MIQTAGEDPTVRNVYLYDAGRNLLWSKGNVPAQAAFSGNGQYVLFASGEKGGALLVNIQGEILWQKGPREIRPGIRALLVSNDAGTILFDQEGIFNREGRNIKRMELGRFCDLSRDGSLIVNHERVGDKVVLNLYDSRGEKKWLNPVGSVPAGRDDAALGVKVNQEASRIALTGNGWEKGYLALYDLQGKELWRRDDLPKFPAGPDQGLELASRYVRVNTGRDIRVYDLDGYLTWISSGKENDYLMSDDGLRVVIGREKEVYFLGPSDYLFRDREKLASPPPSRMVEPPPTAAVEPQAPPPEYPAKATPPAPFPEKPTGPVHPEAVSAPAPPAGVTESVPREMAPAGEPEPDLPAGVKLREQPRDISWTAVIGVLVAFVLLVSAAALIIRRYLHKQEEVRDWPEDDSGP